MWPNLPRLAARLPARPPGLHHGERLGEVPLLALEVERLVAAEAVEGVVDRHGDLGPLGPGPLVVGVDVVDGHVDHAGDAAAGIPGAEDVVLVGPAPAHHDDAVAQL